MARALIWLGGWVAAAAGIWHGLWQGWALAGVLAGAYLLSLRLHGSARCVGCGGRGRHFGWFFTYSRRRCPVCGGRGDYPRIGTRLLMPRHAANLRPPGRRGRNRRR